MIYDLVMKRFFSILSAVALLNFFSNGIAPQPALAASCLSQFPDSAWGAQNAIGDSGQPLGVMKELLGPSGTGNQKLILQNIEVIEEGNSYSYYGNIDSVGHYYPYGASPIDFILRKQMTYYTLKNDFASGLMPVTVKYTYAGLECDTRVVSAAGGINYKYSNRTIPMNDEKQIEAALMAAYPSENFAQAQSDFNQTFLPFSKIKVSSIP